MTSDILMTIEEAVDLIKQILPSKQLNLVKLLVFRQAWFGKGYSAIAKESDYDSNYIRMVGSQLWQALSDVLGKEVNKKNFQSILQEYAQTNPFVISTLPEFPGGPVPLGSRFYIHRHLIEGEAYAELRKPGSLVQIQGPHKMGKSSFLLRLIDHAKDLGYQTVSLDLKQADNAILLQLNSFLRWFCTNISYDLGLESQLAQFWNENLGSKVSCTLYLRQYILEQVKSPLVLVLNEVNRIFEYPNLARDFLPLLRSWHEEGKQDQGLEKLRLVLAYSAEFSSSLRVYKSFFNVGLTLELPELNLEEIEELVKAYELNWASSSLSQKLMNMVGGHPYLIQLALYYLTNYRLFYGDGTSIPLALEKILKEASTPVGIYSDILRRYLACLQENPELALALEQVINTEAGIKLNPIIADKLKSLGLVRLEGEWATIRCELYRLYFRRNLNSENLRAAN